MKIQSAILYNDTSNKKVSDDKLLEKRDFYEQKQEIYSAKGPTQAISFGGSAISGATNGAKKITHKIINFVYDNEAAYTAIYSLLFAGILKPICVLNSHRADEKDKQYIATKNFLQAFIGSFLGLTVGGGFVKKAIDVVKNNLNLITMNNNDTKFVVTSDEEKIKKIAISSLEKEKAGFKTKYRYLKDGENVSSLKAFWQALTKKAVVKETCPNSFNPNKEIFINITQEGDIKPKIKELKETAKSNINIFNNNEKSIEFVKRLKTNGNDKILLQQKNDLINLIMSGADEKQIENQYKTLSMAILDSSAGGTKQQIKEKLKETENLLNKENAQDALNRLFDFAKDKKASETLMETYESVWKQSTGWITSICKAKVSSLLLPTVVSVLFFQKNAKKNEQKNAETKSVPQDNFLVNSAVFNKEKSTFNKVINNSPNRTYPSFTGNLINNLALGVEKLSLSDFGQSVVNKMHKLPPPLNKTSARMSDLESALITTYWVQNTAKSKRIDPDQKLGLNLQNVLVTVVSSTCSFLLDTALDPFIERCKNKYSTALINSAKEAVESKNFKETLETGCKNLLDGEKAAKELLKVLTENTKNFFDINGKLIENTALFDTIENLTKTYGKKLRKFKSLTVFTAVVRFLVPVLMVDISAKIKEKIKETQAKKNKK